MEPQFYILNNVDRPDPKHVVQSISETELVYISEELKGWEDRFGNFSFCSETTNLTQFGFAIEIIDDKAVFIKTKPSTAKYSNGSRRLWQGEDKFVLRLKPLLEDCNE